MNDVFIVDGGKKQQDVKVVSDFSGDFTTYIDEASATVTYVGKAPIGTATSASGWQIKKIETASTVTSILYADSNNNYDNVWDNRASLTYA